MFRILLALPLLFVGRHAAAQQSLFDFLHERADTATLEIRTDHAQLRKGALDKIYQAAQLIVHLPDTALTFPGKVRTRGHYRLQVCRNPSLKIKLQKKPLIAAGFSDLNELKLVRPCDDGKTGAAYLRRELLTYELHKIYSEHSLRTIAVHLPLGARIGRTRPEELGDQLAFLIEDEEQLAARYGGKINETGHASTKTLDRASYANLCLFNYLILNTDWSVIALHNVEVLQHGADKSLIAIPYDFDYSGFVGTSYATPPEGLDIPSVYTPTWRGYKVQPAELLAAAALFRARADKAEDLINEYPGLTSRSRKRLITRLKAFNKLIENEKRLLRVAR